MNNMKRMLNCKEVNINANSITIEKTTLISTLNCTIDETEQKQLLLKIIPTSKSSLIRTPFYCEFGKNIILGKNVFINANCTILDNNIVEIGDNSLIGPNTSICTITHSTNVYLRNKGYGIAKPIKIGNNVFIGANCTILQGVTIGDNSIIGAGAVVTKDIPSNTIAYGVPAKIKRKFD